MSHCLFFRRAIDSFQQVVSLQMILDNRDKERKTDICALVQNTSCCENCRVSRDLQGNRHKALDETEILRYADTNRKKFPKIYTPKGACTKRRNHKFRGEET